MISRSHICFSLILALAALPLSASVMGRVELKDSRDPRVRKTRDFSGVVVWLEPISSHARVDRPGRARMVQKGKRFTPHILAVQVGAAVDFPNLDPIFHNAFSNFSGQIFDIGLYAPGSSRTVHFDRPGIVRIFCNIHSTMSAVIAVLDTPYFATTSPSGEFSIPNVPGGDYTLHFFHERATPQTLKHLERRISVASEPVTLAVVAVSESDYLPVPHKNKYGRDYPPVEDGYTPGSR